MGTHICMAESLHCSPETITFVNRLYPNTKYKVKKKNHNVPNNIDSFSSRNVLLCQDPALSLMETLLALSCGCTFSGKLSRRWCF